jgi:hypothetical protein
MAARDGASSVLGRLIRITPLTLQGTVDTTKPVFVTKGFISASFSPEYEDGDEITEKAADGSVCISYKADDTLKRLNFNLSLCSPDPEAAAVLAGGLLLRGSDRCDDDDEGLITGYSSPAVGAAADNPVSIEIWSIANVGGKAASGTPFWHWVFPYVKVRYTGDREFGNSALSNEFEGQGLGNDALVSGGLYYAAGQSMAGFPGGINEDWVKYKAALSNPFSYIRSCDPLPNTGFHWVGSPTNWANAQVIVPPAS